MREGKDSNKVGVCDPMEGTIRWKSACLSEFVNRWAEGSLLF